MAKTNLYVIRHGKTMFNTMGRAQGWSDTPLTPEGERGIQALGIGLRESGLDFTHAYSSDSGRAIQTMGIILDELGLKDQIPHRFDKRIREWCFGSFDGAYGSELFHGVIPHLYHIINYKDLSLEDLVNVIYQVDTAGWAETWEAVSHRILEGFTAIAKAVEEQGGGNALVVSHSWTIQTLICLLQAKANLNLPLPNGSVSLLEYEDGQFTVRSIGDASYRQIGEAIQKD